ncbi:hypothetical protein Tco_0753599 [Tanacetum coccineum]
MRTIQKAHDAALDDGVVLVKRCGYFFLNWSSRDADGSICCYHLDLILIRIRLEAVEDVRRIANATEDNNSFQSHMSRVKPRGISANNVDFKIGIGSDDVALV